MSLLQKLIGAVTIGLVCGLSHAQETSVQIYAIALDHRLNEQGTKHYNEFLRALSEKGLRFKLRVRTLKRSQMSFKSETTSCQFPATIHAITTNDKDITKDRLIASEPIDRVSLRVFTHASQPVITELSALEGKRIALLNGVDPNIFLKGINADIDITPNEDIRIKMLYAGRIDAILGFMPDVFLAAENLGFPVPKYSEKLALFLNEGAAVVCHDTPVNRAFIARANGYIKELKQSGKLREILGPHADIVL